MWDVHLGNIEKQPLYNPVQWSNHKNMQAYFVVVVIAQAELFTYDMVRHNDFTES